MPKSSGALPKLSIVQAKVMLWMSQGWDARVAHGSVVEINGKHICNTATLHSLEKSGLVAKEENGLWSATPEGKKLSPGYLNMDRELS